MSGYLDAARDLNELGYHTFPCREAGKEPLCPHGVHEATRDERQQLHWADKWPYANRGIALGPSDMLTVDIDAKHGASPGDVIGELELDFTNARDDRHRDRARTQRSVPQLARR